MWIGIDPGMTATGVVLRHGKDLIAWDVILTKNHEIGTRRPGISTMRRIVSVVQEMTRSLDQLDGVAIEDVVEPNGHLGMTNLAGILRTSEVLGFLRHEFPQAVLIRPNRNGTRPLATYPTELVTVGEMRNAKRKGTLWGPAPENSDMRHARSAWDVAGAGASQTPQLW